MPIIVGIDGTGSDVIPGFGRNGRYDAAFANSFVSRICRRNPDAQYNRGPLVLGGGLHGAVSNAKRFIEEKRQEKGDGEPILLTGFSRGGLGVLIVARYLRDEGIPVEAMLLFDAIDMYMFADVKKVPTNVRHVFHARSHPDAGSRENWRNKDCGANPNSPQVNYTEQSFRCTHGAMGGTAQTDPNNPNGMIGELGSGPTNVTFANNPIVSEQVWLAVQPFIRTHNFM